MCSSTFMAFCQNIFEFLSFWGGYDGSRPNLICSYGRAFHKDSEHTSLVSTKITFSQNPYTVKHRNNGKIHRRQNFHYLDAFHYSESWLSIVKWDYHSIKFCIKLALWEVFYLNFHIPGHFDVVFSYHPSPLAICIKKDKTTLTWWQFLQSTFCEYFLLFNF